MYDVKVHIIIDAVKRSHLCTPGFTELFYDINRDLTKIQKIEFTFDFHASHQCCWDRYDCGDYYDKNGIYINKIVVDHNDITLWGWNQIVNLTWTHQTGLPTDYFNNVNLRCITSGMKISIDLPEYISLHRHILQCTTPEVYSNRSRIDAKLYHMLSTF